MEAMRRTRWALVVIASTVFAGVPSGVLAKTIIINPPGSAGANEYSEVIPSSAGNVTPPSGGGGSGKPASGITPLGRGRAGVVRLQHLGSDGRSAAAFAASSAPTPAPSARNRGGSGRPAASPNGSASAGIASTLTGSDAGGLGWLLPLLFATALLGAVGILAARFRRSAQPPQHGA